MSLARRLAASGLGLFLCTTVVIAQSSDAIESWTAPPYWMPVKAPALDKRAEVGLAPQEVEAVPTAPLAFTGTTPCRVADTRGNGFSGPYGPPQLTPAGRTVTIINTCGIPAAAQAVSFNFSALNVPGAGFLVAYPAGGAFPPVATMTYNQNTPNLSNAAVVPLGTAGAITVVAAVVSIDLVIDVNGYYAPQTVVTTVNNLSGAVTLAAGSNVSITPSGQTLTIANTAPAAWRLTGNSGTTAGTNFLGTTDDEPLDLKVNGDRGLRIEPLSSTGIWGPNLIGGFAGNFVTAGKVGATIGGGGQTGAAFVNRVIEDFGTVGGGWGNVAQGYAAVVDGGRGNAAGNHASVGGGQENVAAGNFATIPGGLSNAAAGNYSFAGGRRAKANDPGAFVWGDGTDEDVSSSGTNSFVVRATGGFEFLLGSGVLCELHDASGWICGSPSDRALKRDVSPVDARETLERLVAMPIQTWSYIAHEPAARHMGPMAQDFAEAYGLGSDDKRINPLDANGVALAAIQGLYELVEEKNIEIGTLRGELRQLRARLDALENPIPKGR